MQAFSSTAGSRIGGAIPPALMKKDAADRKEIELIHVPSVYYRCPHFLGQFPTVILWHPSFWGLETPKPTKKKHLEFCQVNVAGGNQDKATSLPSGVLAICFLYYIASRTKWNKKTG